MKTSVPLAFAAVSLSGFSAARAQAPAGLPPAQAPSSAPVSVPDQSPFTDSNPRSFYAAPPTPYTSAVPGAESALDPARSVGDQLVNDALRWGPFRFHPFLAYRFTYSDGLLAAPGEPTQTVLHSITPGFRAISEHVALSYAPSLNYYTKGPYEDSVNHNASIALNFGYGDWTFGLSHAYSVGSEVLVETAMQTDTETHGTTLSAEYQLSDRTSLQFTVSQFLNDTGGEGDTGSFNDSKTWSTMNWFNYAVSDETQVGAGLGGGYSDVDLGSDMTYEQIQGRISWKPGLKTEVAVNGGFEIRQFLAEDGADDAVNPIYGLSAAYHPFEATSLTLNANRAVTASLYADEITDTMTGSLTLAQRFLERFQASLSGGVSFIQYEGTSRVQQSGFGEREDDVIFGSVGLSTVFLKKATASAFYTHSQNNSTLEGYTYDSNTISLSVAYQF